jgi:serine phosphatase RsbU (regulator of sigma subunit)
MKTIFVMRRFLNTCIFLFVGLSFISGQSSVLDSLKLLVEKSEGKEKLQLYKDISQEVYKSDQLKAIDYLNQGIIYAKSTGDDNLTGTAYKNCGLLYFENLSDDLKAEDAFQNAFTYFEKAGNKEETGNVLNSLANIKNYINQIEQSIAYSQKAIEVAKSVHDLKTESGAYYNMGNSYYNQNDFEKALEYHKKSLEIRQEMKDNKLIASSLNRLGNLAFSKQDFKLAEEYYLQVLTIRREEKEKKGEGIALLNLGNANNQMGNMDKAIAYYKQAEEIFKALDFKQGIASTMNGMGVIYGFWEMYPSALKVYLETLEIVEQLGDQKEIANTLTNIGIVYNNMINDTLKKVYGENFRDTIYNKKIRLNYETVNSAIHYHTLSLEKRRQLNDIRGIGTSLANLGITYSYIGDIKKARQYFEEWLAIADQIQDDDQQTAIYIALGQLYRYEGKFENAIDFFTRAQITAQKTNMKLYIQRTAEELADVYELKGDYRQALDNYKKFREVKDSIMTEEGQKLISEMQVKYETDSKEKENQLLRKDQQINESRLKQQRFAIYTFLFVILAVVVFVIMLIRQNNQKKKANLELAKKNALITEQKKEITDSIQYASRIQKAILPPQEMLASLLPDHFILYRPRDIVSGDYYWISQKGNRIYVMAADCTGHGVPGAFMSMLGVAFLNEIVSKHGEIPANQLLNELRKQIIESLHQTGREGENQDGMDVALYVVDREEMSLEYSGANNSLIILREGEELIELKADKFPIGIHRLADNSFTNYKIHIRKNDMIYSFSDGYPDQFGGPSGKKFMIKNFKRTLQDIYLKPMAEQKEILEHTLDEWMIGHHQIDDIMVIGVRV